MTSMLNFLEYLGILDLYVVAVAVLHIQYKEGCGGLGK